MSQKIYRNVATKQQAYRDREAAKKRAAVMTTNHERGWHDPRNYCRGVKGCPLCTVTPTQSSVTVAVTR